MPTDLDYWLNKRPTSYAKHKANKIFVVFPRQGIVAPIAEVDPNHSDYQTIKDG